LFALYRVIYVALFTRRLQHQLRSHFAATVDHPFRPVGELLDDLQPSAGRPTLIGGQRY
jgi:hypothetical protein